MTIRFTRRPFRPAPSLDLYIATNSHRSALSQINHSLDSGNGISTLEGESGVGKTLVALKLLTDRSATTTPVYLPSCRFVKPADFYQAILFDLGKPYAGLSENELRLGVQDILLSNAAVNQPTIIVLDDAYSLNDAVLSELRALNNLTAHGNAAASFILVDARLTPSRQAAIVTRMGPPCHLGLLSGKESESFLREQIALAGGSKECFSDEAKAMIAPHGQGVVRTINRIAGTALAIATEAGEDCVDVEAVLEALSRLAPSEQPAHLPPAEESITRRVDSGSTHHDVIAGRTPKQKARKRKAA